MGALTDTILSDATIQSAADSLARLDALQIAIQEEAANDDALNHDEGVGSVFGLAQTARSRFELPSASEAKQQMSPEVVSALTDRLVPALADTVRELEQLWTDVKAAVANGENGQTKVDEFLAAAEDENSALMRVQAGLEELQAIAQRIALEGLFS